MVDVTGVHHVKLPVSDLGRSRDWYERALGLVVGREFEEDGVLQGLALSNSTGSVQVALRRDPVRAAAFAGFDLLALAVAERADVESWRDHLDAGGHTHGGIVTGSEGGSVLVGLHDPDRIEIRLYAD